EALAVGRDPDRDVVAFARLPADGGQGHLALFRGRVQDVGGKRCHERTNLPSFESIPWLREGRSGQDVQRYGWGAAIESHAGDRKDETAVARKRQAAWIKKVVV